MNRKNELDVNDLLNNLDSAPKDKKEGKKPKQNNDWDEDEDTGFALGREDNTTVPKSKTTKKKTQAKGWEVKPEAEPKVEEVVAPVQQQETTGKRVMKLPRGDAKPTPSQNVDLTGELFPELGQDAPKKKEKKHEPVVQQQVESKPSDGPRRFMNANKTERGEHFVPLDPNLAPKVLPPKEEKPVIQTQTQTPQTQTQTSTEKVETTTPVKRDNIFQRNQEAVKEIIPEDSKFKFGEGPKKFSGGAKISFKREEEKSELEEMRLKKEREVEARLQKERDEAAKEREQWKAAKEAKETNKEEGVVVEETEQKRPAKFSNNKKEGEHRPAFKKAEEKPQAPVEKPAEVQEEPKSKVPVEKIEVNGTLSKKGWGEGAILKKPAKK